MRLLDNVLCALVLGALIPRAALAQEAVAPTDIEETKVSVRSLADHGYELFEAGRHEEALAAFRRAEWQYHAPTIVLMMARSYERIGKLLEAQWNYEVVVAERLDASSPQAFRDAQQAAIAELAALNRRIPALQILITGANPARVKLSVDGAAIAPGAGPILKDPGRAVVVARIPGRPPVERVVVLKEGGVERLTLDLGARAAVAPEPAADAPARRSVPAMAPEPAAGAPARGSMLPAAIAFGAAGLGLGVGAVTFAMAKAKRDDIRSDCTLFGDCFPADHLRADRAQTLTTVSTVGFVAGGLAAAAGVTLLVLRPGSGAPGVPKDTAVQVAVGPGSAQVAGRF